MAPYYLRALSVAFLLLYAGAEGGYLGVLSGAEPSPGLGTTESLLSFESDIRPILKTHCFHCHGEGEALKGDLDLRLRRFMDKKSDSGSILVPGNPSLSRLFLMTRDGEMPKGEKRLSDAEVQKIGKWIASGARTLRPEPMEIPKGFFITEEERSFWSFRPVRQLTPPSVTSNRLAQVRNPIDAFLLEKLESLGLSYAPEADRVSLIRRVYFDLLGLPPSPEAVQEFVQDSGSDAYERLLDRVLQKPEYGERWGRHWLDVAGYSDSNGYAEADSVRPHAWRYRDYVIRSFNQDKPFDQFIVEQLAGDELAGICTTNTALAVDQARVQECLVATGFLRMAPDGTGDGPTDPGLARNQVVAETLKIVSSSLLGLTVGCAQCHDHRYDPISQVDYYRFRAVFEPAFDWKSWRSPAERAVSLYLPADRKKAEEIEVEARKLDQAAEVLRKELLEKVFEKELAKLPEDLREPVKVARNTPRDKRTPEQVALFKAHPAADVQGALDLYDPEAYKKVVAEQGKASALRGTKPPEPMIMALTERPGIPPSTQVFFRGDHEQPKQTVEPAELEVLGGKRLEAVQGLPSSGRRLAYARWLTNGRHPLVTRVLVNRFWMQHFGRGLVSTTGDFGHLGERPTHPELLDWLATQFVAGEWKLKSFHKLLMTSTAYRQSSTHAESLEQDPDNRYYARMKMHRLDAETLRDSILLVSGNLNAEKEGPPVSIAQDGAGRVVTGQQKNNERGDPAFAEPIGPSAFRRSVYVQARRSLPLTVLETFDAPVMSPNCENRNISTVAPQSLLMLNDTFVLAQSRAFATRLQKERPGDLRAQLNQAWLLAFQRPPSDAELKEGLLFIAEEAESIRSVMALRAAAAPPKEGNKPPPSDSSADSYSLALASLCQVLLAQNRFLYSD